MPRRSVGARADRAVDKRRSHRVRLYSPIAGEIDGIRATLVDLSIHGAQLEAPIALSVGGPAWVRLTLDGVSVELDAIVMRCRLDRSLHRDAIVYDTGVQFDADDDAIERVRELLRSVATNDLAARREYAKRDRA